MVSWGIHLTEISWWSTVPKIAPGISEIFELTPTNWNGPGFVSWVSFWHVVYSSTEILAWSRARGEKRSIPDTVPVISVHTEHVLCTRPCAGHSLPAALPSHALRRILLLFLFDRWRNWDARTWTRASRLVKSDRGQVLASIQIVLTGCCSLVLGLCIYLFIYLFYLFIFLKRFFWCGPFLNLFIYLFIYLWLCWVFVSVQGLSLVAASGGHSSSRCAGLTIVASLVAEHRLQTHRLSNCGSQAQLLRGMWGLPRPGLEPVSPALAGRFSTTAPPGKPTEIYFDSITICNYIIKTTFEAIYFYIC